MYSVDSVQKKVLTLIEGLYKLQEMLVSDALVQEVESMVTALERFPEAHGEAVHDAHFPTD